MGNRPSNGVPCRVSEWSQIGHMPGRFAHVRLRFLADSAAPVGSFRGGRPTQRICPLDMCRYGWVSTPVMVGLLVLFNPGEMVDPGCKVPVEFDL
jgi:hypothetical protein